VRHVITTGTVGEGLYFQDGTSSSPCTVNWGAAAGNEDLFRPAMLLTAVGAAKLLDKPTMDGVATRHYSFGAAALSLPADTTASGEAWIAMDGGYVVKYVLDITGAESFFGAGVQGTRHVEYLLSEVGANPQVVYPPGCEPVLDMPAMEDATDLIRLPGLLGYNTNAATGDIITFYAGELARQGWQKLSEDVRDTGLATATFVVPDKGVSAIVAVSVEGDSRRVTVMSPAQGSAETSPENPGAQATAMANNPSIRVALALNILFGMVPKQPGPSSYHLEVIHQSPVWSSGTIAQKNDSMNADVQGKNIHYTRRITSPGGLTTTSETYLIDNQEYAVVNGKVQAPVTNSLTWTLWSLDLSTMLSAGSSGTTVAGTEELHGRNVNVYNVNGSGLSLPGIAGNLSEISSIAGQIWVDQATGTLLKALLDYKADVRDGSGNLKGSGDGHLEITVTQFDNVTVSLP